MFQYIRRLTTPAVIALALVGGACAKKDSDQLAQDTMLNRDLELANRDTAAQPALSDVPATNAPAPAPRPTARRTTAPRAATQAPAATSPGNVVTRTTGAAAERRTGMIAAGSTISLSSGSRICTNTNRVGETFQATVRETVTGSNGSAIPAGATATVEITSLSRSDNANDPVRIGLRVRSITFGGRTYAVSATTASADVTRIRSTRSGKDAQKVATGAAIGAVIGQVLGKNTKSTVIGGAVGAAAGAATAAATANYDGCIEPGKGIVITLNSATQVVV